MSDDIFISYASEDRGKAKPLADALQGKGWSVFWDQRLIPGERFRDKLEEKLEEAKCVIVLWSRKSVESQWVLDEAGEAAKRRCLVPALIEDVRIPMGFRQIQTAKLMDWEGELDHPEFELLVHAVGVTIGQQEPTVVDDRMRPDKEATPVPAPQKPKSTRPRKPKPKPEPEKRSLKETIRETGLKFQEVPGGVLAVPFGGDRINQVIIQVRELRGGITYFAAPLPELGRRRRESGLTGLLRTSFTVNYVKALSVESGMGMVVEMPSPLVSPKVAEGVIRGLVHLADVTEKDLAEKGSWEERMVKSALAQARFITVDVDKAKEDIPDRLEAAGLDCERPREDAFITTIEIAGKGLKVLARVSDKVISFILYLPGVKPTGDKNKYLGHLLDMNRVANVGKVGLDSDGDVAFLYEVPELLPDTVEHMKEQFTRLLALAVTLHAGES